MNTPKGRVSFPNVFKPRYNELSKKEEYSITLLFSKDADLSALKEEAAKACAEKWGQDKTKWPKNLRSPFRDQVEKMKDGVMPTGCEAGAMFMNLKSKQKPIVVDQKVQVILDETEFYPGCWAIASVHCYAYDQAGNRGVSFSLNNIQKVAEGEKFSGRSTAEADFAPVSGVETVSTKQKDALDAFLN